MNGPRVMVVGWDGATFDIIRPLLAQGKMPSLARMLDKGASGRLESTIPAVTPVAWTSMTTGCNPGKHGIFDGHQYDLESGRMRFVSAAMRRVPPIWSLLSAQGRRSAVMNVPVTYPPDPIDGVVVPGMFTPPGARDAILPADFRRDFERRFGPHADSPPRYDDPARYLDSLLRGVERRREMIEFMMDHGRWDFLFAVFMETDRVQHFFWEYRDPDHPRHAALGDAVERVYLALDGALQRLMDKAGTETTLALTSDHGAGPLHTGVFINRWFVDNGFLAVKTPMDVLLKPVAPSPLGRLARKAAARIGLADKQQIADDLNNRFRSAIDWENTRAWSDGMGGSVYFNPAKVTKTLRDELTFAIYNDLINLRDPDGAPVIEAIHRREDVYVGPSTPQAPDLIVECAPGYQIYAPHEFLLHGAGDPTSLFVRHPWSGRHERHGIFALHGPGVRIGTNFGECAMIDVAPTLLALMGCPIPAHMDGRAVAAALDFTPPEARRNETDWTSPGADEISADAEEAMRTSLKALGYM